LPDYLPYSTSVENPAPDEAVTFDELSRTMQHITRSLAAKYRHANRPVHAKSHGLLVGRLEVLPTLAPELAQGLFTTPGSYPVVMRFSTNPGDILADNVSTPKGLAVKVLNVEGEMLPSNAGNTTQDFVCVNANAFGAPDPAGFLESLRTFDKTLNTPEEVKHAASVVAQVANSALKLIHHPSGTLEAIGAAPTHILGESFSTVAPLRWGEFVAKVGIAPASESLSSLTGKHVDLSLDYNELEVIIKKFFHNETAVWEVKAQLALAPRAGQTADDRDFSIEKADKPWPEEESPWRVIGRITVSPQESYSDARQLFVDEQLSFTPWHALAAHRPLGGIMRSRLKAYEEAAKFRAQRNGRIIREPKSIDEVPN
jgi:catalase